MQTTLTNVDAFYDLRPDELMTVRLSRPHTLLARRAPVWVTRAGDAEDYWLMPGESLVLERGRRYWISAEEGAELRLERRLERSVSESGSLSGMLRTWLRRDGARRCKADCNAAA